MPTKAHLGPSVAAWNGHAASREAGFNLEESTVGR